MKDVHSIIYSKRLEIMNLRLEFSEVMVDQNTSRARTLIKERGIYLSSELSSLLWQ